MDPAASNPSTSAGSPPDGPPAKRTRQDPPPAEEPAPLPPKRREPGKDVPRAREASDLGLLAQLSNRLSAPYSTLDTIYVQVETAAMGDFFASIRNALIEQVYLDSVDLPANLISVADWIIVCRYMVKSRVDQVYGSLTGRRPDGRTPIPRNMKVPKILSDVANSIGTHLINQGAAMVCPQSEPNPLQAAERLNTLATNERLSAFSRLVLLAEMRGFIKTGYISSVPEGTGWWILTARTPAQQDHICAGNAGTANVFGCFPEWTPADALFAAVVQRGND